MANDEMKDGPTSTVTTRPATAIILAAGRSTRMKTDVPKVMHEICGRPMLAWVIDACRAAGLNEFHIVVGFGQEVVRAAFGKEPGVRFVEQREQKGTGHAVMMAADALAVFDGDVVVIAGDMPLLRAETLRDLLGGHRTTCSVASIVTTVLDDPTGYGRIIRDAKGEFVKIVEHRDCTPEQLAFNEVNPSYYCFDCKTLFAALKQIKPDNAKGELYITDVLGIVRQQGRTVRAAVRARATEAMGVNSRADLAQIGKLMQERIATRWMEAGVTIVDPANTWIDGRATIGAESIIKPFSYIEGVARVGARCDIGPYAYVGDGVVVQDGARIGPGAMNAFDAVAGGARLGHDDKRTSRAVRRPPVAAVREDVS